MRCSIFLILLFACLNMVQAKDDAEAVESPPRQMRLLTVGEAPPFRQEIRDGVRYQLPAPPGSLPPVELDVMIPAVDGKEKGSGTLRLRIGNISAPITVPGGAGPLVLRLPKISPEERPWHRLERPESGDFIVVMWRDQRNNTWDKPSAFVMPADLPTGQASLLNVTTLPIAVVYQGERIGLPRLKPLMRPLKPGKALALQVGLAKGSKLQRLISRSLEQPPGRHSLVVFYRSDGEKPRRPLGVKVVRLIAE